MSRSRTRERRQQREQERKRQQRIVFAGVIAAVAVLLVIFLVLASQPADANIPEETVAKYEGIAQSVTDEGFPVLGNPDAPVQVVEYSSFDCPHCGEFYSTAIDSLIERAEAGEIRFTYVPIHGTGGIPNGEGAARAAICAGEQDAFWPYHSALFSWQSLYGNAAFSSNRLSAAVDNLGLDRAQWDMCMSSTRPNTVINAAFDAANGLGADFQGTPTITVNGVSVAASLAAVNTAIDTALASAPPVIPQPEVEETEEATAEAVEETATEETEATEEADE